ncbi:hypothetical protein [Streptomyces silvensis]|uniref:Uncharacterized protein n=1 Tax=Streptomyces silvensis TaxID=1765722 RepID=A0A0W7X3Q8_9ACTN|nr:hypothetical protein [Streptomyces silvensis]KUF17416.1 hypothetical protein AT728_16595 [Streptomyces silvensis]
MNPDLRHLAPLADTLTALLREHGHTPLAEGTGYTLRATWDQTALVLIYWCEPENAHDHLVGGHVHRRGRFLKECVEIIRGAGHQVSRHPTVNEAGRAPVESAIIFPPAEPEPEPLDPSVCRCDPARPCERAARLAVAATQLGNAVQSATNQLLDALHEAAVEPADHAPWGPEGAAALLDHSYGILASLPPLPDTADAQQECRDCDAPACRAANGMARVAVAKAAHLADVRRATLAATRTILDRAHLALTPGDRWQGTLRGTAEELHRVYVTAAAACAAPKDQVHGRYRRSARRRTTGLPVYLRRGGSRYWFVRWSRAIWH